LDVLKDLIGFKTAAPPGSCYQEIVDFLVPIFWQAVIVLLYWAGMLTWFLRRNRRQAVGSKLIRT
jgi:heme/copper-type cytochrome/quinol oxidase subunit 2